MAATAPQQLLLLLLGLGLGASAAAASASGRTMTYWASATNICGDPRSDRHGSAATTCVPSSPRGADSLKALVANAAHVIGTPKYGIGMKGGLSWNGTETPFGQPERDMSELCT